MHPRHDDVPYNWESEGQLPACEACELGELCPTHDTPPAPFDTNEEERMD